MPQTPLNGLRLTIELDLGLEKSGNFILSGKWQPWKEIMQGGSQKIFYGKLHSRKQTKIQLIQRHEHERKHGFIS